MTCASAMTWVEPALMYALRTPRLQVIPPREGRGDHAEHGGRGGVLDPTRPVAARPSTLPVPGRDSHPIVAFTP
jgi:hypothetical protein